MTTVKELIEKLSEMPQNHSAVLQIDGNTYLSEIAVSLEEINTPWSEPEGKSELVILRKKK
ncbi:hypothetical protein LS482_20920 [Sinomicrobium kalidii]|uniref:hypothetical protein n=1 Tax=Sinomicrobium kalidii TaxID=2900738 RepID=UPI001E4E6007|nr:hypothetical protein [Sinomicrobium kalidii]UGU16127.1 hypothetical protein LS482_20920 [Sinomicrobium kalidii]